MSRPARSEIKKFAEEAFGPARDQILLRWGDPGKYAHNRVAQTNNAGGYQPALIEWASGRLRESILAFADAYVKSFWLYQRASDREAEKELKKSAVQMTGGTISAVRGHLQLYSKRTRHSINTGVPFHLEIERAKDSAVKDGMLRLKQQRIQYKTNPRIPESRIFAVLKESGVDADRASFEQFVQALGAYRDQFPEFRTARVEGQQWAAIQRSQVAKWENDSSQYHAQIRKNRQIIALAWQEGKKRASNPEKWRGYRNEFGRLRIDEQASSLNRTPEKRIWAGGDFATGFSAVSDDKRITTHFEEIAARAACDLGCPNEFDPSSFWQACLFIHLNETGKREIFISDKDGEEGGCVRKPLEVSEEICSLLARDAINKSSRTRNELHSAPPLAVEKVSARKAIKDRLPSSITSPQALRRFNEFLDSHPELGLTQFGIAANITDRTLRRFRKTGRANRKTLLSIAAAMKIELRSLVEPE